MMPSRLEVWWAPRVEASEFAAAGIGGDTEADPDVGVPSIHSVADVPVADLVLRGERLQALSLH